MYQRYVKVKGTARERGYQFGVQMKEQIITNYINQTEYYKNKEQFDYKKWEKMACVYRKRPAVDPGHPADRSGPEHRVPLLQGL